MSTVNEYDQRTYSGSENQGRGISAVTVGRRPAARQPVRQNGEQRQMARTTTVSGNASSARQPGVQANSVQSRTQPRPNLDVRLNTGVAGNSRTAASSAGSHASAAARNVSGVRTQQTRNASDARAQQARQAAGTRTRTAGAAGSRSQAGNMRSSAAGRSTNAARNQTAADPRAKARAAAKRRKKRQQKMIMRLVSLMILFVVIIAAAAGTRSHMKTTKMNTFRETGISAMQDGNYESAIENFDQALGLAGKKIGKNEIDILQRRAESEYNLKDYAASLESWKILMDADSSNDEYKKNAVLCMMETGQYDEALQLGIMQSRIYNKMAVEKIKVGDYDGALSVIEQGLGVDDGSAAADLLYNKAVANESRGNYEQALQLFREYVSRFGSDENVEKEISFLQTRVGDSGTASETETENTEDGEEGAAE